MIIFRGVNIYPGQIMEGIGAFPELGGEYQVELTRVAQAVDHLTLLVERKEGISGGGDAALEAKLAARLHTLLLARVEAKIVEPYSLPRTFSKSKRILDRRQG